MVSPVNIRVHDSFPRVFRDQNVVLVNCGGGVVCVDSKRSR